MKKTLAIILAVMLLLTACCASAESPKVGTIGKLGAGKSTETTQAPVSDTDAEISAAAEDEDSAADAAILAAAQDADSDVTAAIDALIQLLADNPQQLRVGHYDESYLFTLSARENAIVLEADVTNAYSYDFYLNSNYICELFNIPNEILLSGILSLEVDILDFDGSIISTMLTEEGGVFALKSVDEANPVVFTAEEGGDLYLNCQSFRYVLNTDALTGLITLAQGMSAYLPDFAGMSAEMEAIENILTYANEMLMDAGLDFGPTYFGDEKHYHIVFDLARIEQAFIKIVDHIFYYKTELASLFEMLEPFVLMADENSDLYEIITTDMDELYSAWQYERNYVSYYGEEPRFDVYIIDGPEGWTLDGFFVFYDSESSCMLTLSGDNDGFSGELMVQYWDYDQYDYVKHPIQIDCTYRDNGFRLSVVPEAAIEYFNGLVMNMYVSGEDFVLSVNSDTFSLNAEKLYGVLDFSFVTSDDDSINLYGKLAYPHLFDLAYTSYWDDMISFSVIQNMFSVQIYGDWPITFTLNP